MKSTKWEEVNCKRKVGYSKREAEEVQVKRFIKTGRVGKIYRCKVCGWWHLTKKVNT